MISLLKAQYINFLEENDLLMLLIAKVKPIASKVISGLRSIELL